MIDIAALYRQIDPLRPLEADEDDLYVDWQKRLYPKDDAKAGLARTFLRTASPERPVTRLLTGHRGGGKTTELNRLARSMRLGLGGKKVFVSHLFSQRWLDLEDIQAEDVVLQVVRQLVFDLRGEGMSLVAGWFTAFLQSTLAKMRAIRLDGADIGIDPLKFSFSLKDFPSARDEFRSVLRRQLPTVFDLVNTELLTDARAHLRRKGYDDILLIVDDLDKIPKKLIDGGHTNHEQLFLENAPILRAIDCSVLMTIPIDLAYSSAQGRLRADYGASITTLPLVPVVDRHGTAGRGRQGEDVLVEIVGRRARAAAGDMGDPLVYADALFEDHALLLRLVRLSGGHLRGLFVLLTELLDRVDELPIGRETVERYVPRAAHDLARGLFAADKEILQRVDASREAIDDPRFFNLLQNHYVFAYEAELDDYWYGLNPLLHELEL